MRYSGYKKEQNVTFYNDIHLFKLGNNVQYLKIFLKAATNFNQKISEKSNGFTFKIYAYRFFTQLIMHLFNFSQLRIYFFGMLSNPNKIQKCINILKICIFCSSNFEQCLQLLIFLRKLFFLVTYFEESVLFTSKIN